MSINLEDTKKKNKEIDPQEVRYRRRKDAIKNFAIVFLVIMLVLTFFSNTIMNYSLPQVAVQYMEQGSITTTIRGTGTVESGDPYNVMVSETRTVSSITCRVGQDVRQGDILFSLNGEDSAELEEAKAALEAAQKAYDDSLLSDSVTAAIIDSSKNNTSVEQYRNQITAAQNEQTQAQADVDEQQKKLDDLQAQLAVLQNTYTPSTEYNKAKEDYDKAYANLTAASAEVDKLNAVDLAYAQYNEALDVYNDYAQQVEDKGADLSAAADYYNSIAGDDTVAESEKTIASSNVTTLNVEYNALVVKKTEAEDAMNAALNSYNSVASTYASAVANSASIYAKYSTAQTDFEQAQAALDMAQANLDAGGVSNTDSINSINSQITAAQNELNRLNGILEEKTKAVNELVSDIDLIRSLNELYSAIDDAQKKVDKITAETAAKDITAPISGTILSVYVVSGRKTDPSTAAVVIQPEGQSYTMSFSVTNDEAKTISVGAAASVANSWWYSDVTGYVESIRPDTSSPNTNKLVTLNLSGSLTSGQSLTMSIDSRTSNYDCIVPNSAIHEDNNGKFILIVESKSSPLGNRYFAVRYDIQVLASDDTKSAIRAGLEGYEYVITTSSKPISAGDQVRLTEN